MNRKLGFVRQNSAFLLEANLGLQVLAPWHHKARPAPKNIVRVIDFHFWIDFGDNRSR